MSIEYIMDLYGLQELNKCSEATYQQLSKRQEHPYFKLYTRYLQAIYRQGRVGQEGPMSQDGPPISLFVILCTALKKKCFVISTNHGVDLLVNMFSSHLSFHKHFIFFSTLLILFSCFAKIVHSCLIIMKPYQEANFHQVPLSQI